MQKSDLPEFKLWLRAMGYRIDTKEVQWQALRFVKPGQPRMYIIYEKKDGTINPDKHAFRIVQNWIHESSPSLRRKANPHLPPNGEETFRATRQHYQNEQRMNTYEEYFHANGSD